MTAGVMRREIASADGGAEFSLIKFLPSALTMTQDDSLYRNIYASLGLFGSFWQLLDWKLEADIKKYLGDIPFGRGDIVFLFTEYEIANHFLVQRAKARGAKVFIVDEGIGTYIINNYPRVSKGSSLKQRIIGEVIRHGQGFHKSQRLTGNGTLYFPRLADEYYDGYLLFYRFPIRRDIPQVHVEMPGMGEPIPNLDRDAVILLGEGLHGYHMNEGDYIRSLKMLAQAAARSFKHVYFKFHHCELKVLDRPLFRDLQKQVRDLGINIIDFDKPVPVETLVPQLDFPPRFVVGYFSTALLNLFAAGCEPIFTCHLIKDKNFDFFVVEGLLDSIGYHLISSYDDINQDYTSGLTFDKIFSSGTTIGDFYRTVKDNRS